MPRNKPLYFYYKLSGDTFESKTILDRFVGTFTDYTFFKTPSNPNFFYYKFFQVMTKLFD